MRVHHRGHPSGNDKDGFALHDDIRQGVGDQEGGGASFDALFPRGPTDLRSHLQFWRVYTSFFLGGTFMHPLNGIRTQETI